MAFDITMLAGPVVGAAIGYFTNYIAVKMLFRPLYPVYLGKWQLPFTPGIIPKGRERLAKAVGEAVGEVLLTKKDFEQLLLSEQMQETVKNQISVFYQKGITNQNTIKEFAEKQTSEETVDQFLTKTIETVGELLYHKVTEMDFGSIVGEKVAEVIRQKTQGTLLAMMLNDKMIAGMEQMIRKELNQYLEEHGKALIEEKTKEEVYRFADKTIAETVEGLPVTEENLEQLMLSLYRRIITDYFGTIMEYIPISQIVEEKIRTMDVKEIEKLTLSVMEKELHSIINLGALIGLIIGCINLCF
ncbi:MAG: DUF445 family protein [Lachnospiraceae bacterium]|nr:DUF445 family protein [Lachnospiraceae bacterium]